MFKLEMISKKYGKKTIIDNLSFDFSPGELYIITGDNGAGKSTLFKIMLNIIKYDGNALLSSGKSISGLVEGPYFYGYLTVEEQLKYLLSNKVNMNDEINHYLSRFQIYDFKDNKISKLSSGMKQKVSLIYALLTKCDYLILDEPTNNLDITSYKVLIECIKEQINAGKTIIISTHSKTLIHALDGKVLHLSDGVFKETIITDKNMVSIECNRLDELIKHLDNLQVHYSKEISLVSFEFDRDLIAEIIISSEEYQISKIIFGGDTDV